MSGVSSISEYVELHNLVSDLIFKFSEDIKTAAKLEQYKKYINQKNVVVASPHKIFGPESNDLALQLRKHGFNKVVLAGMSANLCIDSHLRDLVEDGFEVAVVTDATAGTIIPDYDIDGYKAAIGNFRLISSHLFKTDEVVKEFSKLYTKKK